MIHRTGIVSMVALTSFLCCGMTAPDGCKGGSGPSIVGPVVAVGAVVAVAITVPVVISHNKHNVHGCVFQGAGGLELQDGAADGSSFKTYALAGNITEIKVGDRVRLHGSKMKHGKVTGGAQTFTVETVSKDYGPCRVPLSHAGDATPKV